MYTLVKRGGEMVSKGRNEKKKNFFLKKFFSKKFLNFLFFLKMEKNVLVVKNINYFLCLNNIILLVNFLDRSYYLSITSLENFFEKNEKW